MRVAILVSLALSLLAAPDVGATAEGALALSKFHLESEGIGLSGPIHISGVSSAKGISRLEVKAFGRTYSLSEAQISRLRGAQFNGLRLSYIGSPEDRSRTVFIWFSVGFTSGTVLASKTVTLSEDGSVVVTTEK